MRLLLLACLLTVALLDTSSSSELLQDQSALRDAKLDSQLGDETAKETSLPLVEDEDHVLQQQDDDDDDDDDDEVNLADRQQNSDDDDDDDANFVNRQQDRDDIKKEQDTDDAISQMLAEEISNLQVKNELNDQAKYIKGKQYAKDKVSEDETQSAANERKSDITKEQGDSDDDDDDDDDGVDELATAIEQDETGVKDAHSHQKTSETLQNEAVEQTKDGVTNEQQDEDDSDDGVPNGETQELDFDDGDKAVQAVMVELENNADNMEDDDPVYEQDEDLAYDPDESANEQNDGDDNDDDDGDNASNESVNIQENNISNQQENVDKSDTVEREIQKDKSKEHSC